MIGLKYKRNQIMGKQRGIYHRKITPLWPRRNGIVESFMKNINKAIRTSLIDNRPWRQAISSTLSNYRNTPHSITNYKPTFLFFNRNIRTGLPSIPEISQHYESVLNNQRNHYERIVQNNHKENPDNSINVNDTVLLKRERKDNKFQSNFYHQPFTVKDKKGTMITVENKETGQQYTRNQSYLKLYKNPNLKADHKTTEYHGNDKQEQPIRKRYPLRSRKP